MEKMHMEASMVNRLWARAVASFSLGIAFILLISAIVAVKSIPAQILVVILGSISPIFLWSFYSCQNDTSYWMSNVQVIVPFFFYGALGGYLLITKPSINFSYMKTVAASFFATIVGLILAAFFLSNSSPCLGQ